MIFAVCALLTLAALVYIFLAPTQLELSPEKSRLAYLQERREVVYENLRDLNFEYRAGKFPEGDYQTMKTALEQEAAKLLAEISELEKFSRSAIAPPAGETGVTS